MHVSSQTRAKQARAVTESTKEFSQKKNMGVILSTLEISRVKLRAISDLLLESQMGDVTECFHLIKHKDPNTRAI